ncbi:MAG: Vitamin B12 dependent methionine synthase activation subunit [Lachnospiraceae bacterium]|nr:Vitamin B12 dependent methionine synthase activation subunit [Lachnospiraceae bacterium]
MDNTVHTYIADNTELIIPGREVARYLGYSREAIVAGDELIDATIEKVRGIMAGKAVYCRYTLEFFGDDGIVMPYGRIHSSQLRGNLDGCSMIYIFAATIGAAFDRELSRARVRSLADAALLQAAGAAAIEAVCDDLNSRLAKEAEAEGYKLHRRFSPGYGDFLLENQKGLFEVLNPSKFIGLSLMDTMIMSPEKSVSAVIGAER